MVDRPKQIVQRMVSVTYLTHDQLAVAPSPPLTFG